MASNSNKKNLIQLAADRLSTPDGSRAASKYDFVKVKVWLGEDMAHYYVLSRFLISRMLTVTKVPHQKAVKIALDVKKHLVDNDRLDITQAELETILFSVMRSKGFGDEFINRYRMVNQFFQQKRPLIILICGSTCTGKSTFAQQLASRLNLPNVLQTDILYELLRTGGLGELSSAPLWGREGLSDDELISEFQKECRIIRQGLEGDLCKTIKDGKPIIIEGLHLDPGLYLDEFGRHGMIGMGGAFSLELPPDATATAALLGVQAAQEKSSGPGSVSESLANMPPSPSGPLSSHGGSDDGRERERERRGAGSPGVGLASDHPTSFPLPPPSPSSPLRDSEEPLPARRSASFSDAAASGLGYTSPGYSKQSPWRHLQPGGFLHRLLHRPSSAKASPQGAGGDEQLLLQQQQQQTAGEDGVVLRPPQWLRRHATVPSPQQAQQQGAQQQQGVAAAAQGVLRTASLGHVTFILSDDAEVLAPVPVVPGTEVLLPTSPSGNLPGQGLPAQLQVESAGTAAAAEAAAAAIAAAGTPLLPESLAPGSPSGGSGGDATRGSSSPPGPQHGGGAVPGVSRLPLGSSSSSAEAEEEAGQSQAGPFAEAAPPAWATPAAAGLARLPSPRDSQGPVFVPLVLAMDPRDYELVVQEWQAAQGGFWEKAAAGEGGTGAPAGGSPRGGAASSGDGAVLHRLRVLQDYLCAYGSVGVPVVGVGVGSFNETLDKLHDYLLRCIEMSTDGAGAGGL